ncbi:zinc finger protein 362-like isoform X1 [Acanthaster planci]|uniref:Zinc finger protein 362-like isoform X1 n=1 Tax=Acanthaster planci TaxID=133434 RepID=A0A8B7Z4K0_ACAPL|nr:zinc finger protein 362-like isoform X1 [Acanthaster planci]XP_022100557.1 zinc finger protein 362-like isoform X1 [Acanthaster planci]XP_022100558.1 zinc finger protein 362-like isoform X1 [Acanthaster planci]XP_022100559.1 zinc finger protein 362-like isoform X1 [Acanthaster planci]
MSLQRPPFSPPASHVTFWQSEVEQLQRNHHFSSQVPGMEPRPPLTPAKPPTGYECNKCCARFASIASHVAHEIAGCVTMPPSTSQQQAAPLYTRNTVQPTPVINQATSRPATAGSNGLPNHSGNTSSPRGKSSHKAEKVTSPRSFLEAEQGGQEYHCKICPQVYYSKSDVLLHARSHTEGKPYKCEECGKGFATTSYLSQHSRVHTNHKPYNCTYCDKSFKQLSHLQQHTRIHTGMKPYKCFDAGCDKAFSQLSNLQQHWRRHNKDKPYKCRDCYRAYDELDKLQNHSLSHENTRREKRFSCGVCGKTYSLEVYLQKHMEKHPQIASNGLANMPIVDSNKQSNSSAGSNLTHHKKHKKSKKKSNSDSASTMNMHQPSMNMNEYSSAETTSHLVPMLMHLQAPDSVLQPLTLPPRSGVQSQTTDAKSSAQPHGFPAHTATSPSVGSHPLNLHIPMPTSLGYMNRGPAVFSTESPTFTSSSPAFQSPSHIVDSRMPYFPLPVSAPNVSHVIQA